MTYGIFIRWQSRQPAYPCYRELQLFLSLRWWSHSTRSKNKYIPFLDRETGDRRRRWDIRRPMLLLGPPHSNFRAENRGAVTLARLRGTYSTAMASPSAISMLTWIRAQKKITLPRRASQPELTIDSTFERDRPRRNVLPGYVDLPQHFLNCASHQRDGSPIIDDVTEIYQRKNYLLLHLK